MVRTMDTFQVRALAVQLNQIWEDERRNIKLKGKSLFNLLGLKKALIEKGEQIQEAIVAHAESMGATWQQDGQLKVEPDKADEMNKWFGDFAQEPMDITYSVITVGETDDIPIAIAEALYDFIEVGE